MPSISLAFWQTDRRDALDELEAAHAKMGGVGPGRRYATQQINQAYAMVLSSQFQGFCRDLHSEAVDHVCRQGPVADLRLDVLRKRLTTGRKLETGNPNPGNLGADFGFFAFELWEALKRHDPANATRNKVMEKFNVWRNAIAHQDFTSKELDGRTTVTLAMVRKWRGTCEALAMDLDSVVGSRLAIILGANPW